MTRNIFLLLTLTAAGAALPAAAQNLADGARFASDDLMGTARYRSMAGAFGALGGDPSAMGDNPAGMAVYRGTSEISLTPHLASVRTETSGSVTGKEKKNDFSIGNLAYVLSFKTENAKSLVNVNVGIGFNHTEGTDRHYSTGLDRARSSFSDYIANGTNNALISESARTGDQLYFDPGYLGTKDAWGDATMPLMSLMAYEAGVIMDAYDDYGPAGVVSYDRAGGLPYAQRMYVREQNRLDEYNISLSANWSDLIYGGLTLSITDMNSTVMSQIDEAYGPKEYTFYENALETRGSGVNLKLGVIVKPIDAWRIGVAVHTPTWMTMKDVYSGLMETDALTKGSPSGEYEFHYRYSSPWEFQVSTAYVLGTRGLVSFEYDMRDFSSMKYREDRDSRRDPYFGYVNGLIGDYMQMQHTVKVGGELRLTPRLSLRAGYQYRTEPFKAEVYDALQGRSWYVDGGAEWSNENEVMFSSSTKPNYSLLRGQSFVTGGIGWRGTGWFVDLACVARRQHERVAAFPTSDALLYNLDDRGDIVSLGGMSADAEVGAVTADHIPMLTRTLSWDLTLGFKF